MVHNSLGSQGGSRGVRIFDQTGILSLSGGYKEEEEAITHILVNFLSDTSALVC